MYKYPYGDSQQLNLDWIISKIKEMEASGASGGADLEEVSNALLSLTYNTSTAYRRYDYAFLNGKLYRCLTDTSGVFNPTAWQEALIGDDLAVLTRWINAIDAAAVVDVKFNTSGTNGKIQQKYHDQYHDVVEVDYTPVQNSKRPLSSNAGYELNGAINACKWVGGFAANQDIRTQVDALPDNGAFFGTIASPSSSYFPDTTSGYIYVFSYSSGQKHIYYVPNGDSDSIWVLWKSSTWRTWVKEARQSDISNLQSSIATVETGTTASRAYTVGEYVVVSGRLYIVSSAIASGYTFTENTNITSANVTDAITPKEISITAGTNITLSNVKVFEVGKIAVVSFNLATSVDIASNSNLVTGMPKPQSLTWVNAFESTPKIHPLFINSAGQLKPSGSLPAGDSWVVTATYIIS